MDFLKNLPFSPTQALKVSGVLLLGVIVLSVVFKTLGPVFGPMPFGRDGMAVSQVAPTMGGWGMGGGGYDGDAKYDYAEEAAYNTAPGGPTLSMRNALSAVPSVSPMMPQPGSTGDGAEDYEVTDYSVSIETRDRDDTCAGIAKLKEYSYVIFENANEYDRGCNYSFKVERDRAGEILAHIEENFDPREISENTYTIQEQVKDFTSQEDILKKKLATIESTLDSAIVAYDEITELASRTNDAESLARVITSKINTIERLTQERINVSAQLEELGRAKERALDGLTYTRFSVGVYERKYVDFQDLKDSWKRAIAATVNDVNEAIQATTLGLIAFLFLIGQWLLYIIILAFVGKYVWKFAKNLWNS